MPRCCPPAYGLSPSENPRRTSPSVGHAHACAPEATTSAKVDMARTAVNHLVVLLANTRARVAVAVAVVKYGYKEPR